jgi:hypothetical protein
MPAAAVSLDVTISGRISGHEVNGRLRGGGVVDVRTDSGNIEIR